MRAHHRHALAAVVLLGALLLGAAPARASSVSNLTVANGSPSNAAGARTQYVVTFSTSSTGDLASGDTIDVTFPGGTSFGNFGAGNVFVGTTRVGSCQNPNPTTLHTTCTMFAAIAASTSARLEFNGVTNPAAGTANRITLATSSDATSVDSATYTVVAAHTLSNISVTNSPPSNGAGARTQYDISFATTATGGLSSTGVSTIDVTFPAGTTFTNFGAGNVFVGATRVGSCQNPDPATRHTTCSIFDAIAASTNARLEFNGVTNPTTPATNYALTVVTSSDPSPASSQSYTVADAHALSNISVTNSPPSNGAGARSQYEIGFATTATGGLSSTGVSTIDVTFPAGTTFTNFGAGNVFVGATRVGSCQNPNATTRHTVCSIFDAIAPSTNARLEFNGVTNPGAGTTNKITLATSSDPTPVDSANYTVAPANALSGIGVTNASPSSGAGARTQYVVAFTTSLTGGLSSTGVSTIDVTFPAGTTFTNFNAGNVFVGATRVGSCQTPNATTLKTVCSIFDAISPSTNARLEFNGITNPAAGTTNKITLDTSSDPTPVDSANYTVVSANALSNLAVTPGSSSQSATTRYVATFTTSPTGGLASTGVSTIDVTFPAGTTFTGFGAGNVYVGTTRVGSCQTPNATTLKSVCSIFAAIAPSTNTRLEYDGVTNPSTPGTYRMTVATSSDTSPVVSGQYGIAMDTVAPDTSLVSGPAGTTTNPQPTFTFSSSEPSSSFACSVDGAPFTACTSPFVAPPLAVGVHTFRVRAQDSAGNTDATPASQTFTVAATQPSPPPTPTPTAGKTVVVSEVAGSVLVRPKGSKAFVPLNADTGIPLGSTVDTTHGAVELTSQQKSGGASQSAKFYDGIFLVTQQGPVINLKLTQKLAKCTAGKASAAKKKPRKRRLWGDGKGRFRTQGKRSAATVVGTKWLVQDSCAGTLTKVARGVVSVRDFARHKTIRVKAGKHYLAK